MVSDFSIVLIANPHELTNLIIPFEFLHVCMLYSFGRNNILSTAPKIAATDSSAAVSAGI